MPPKRKAINEFVPELPGLDLNRSVACIYHELGCTHVGKLASVATDHETKKMCLSQCSMSSVL